MKNRVIRAGRISAAEVQKMKLKGKPRCPYCQKPLAFIYDDVSGGHLNQKCGNCGQASIVDAATMEVFVIEEAAGFK